MLRTLFLSLEEEATYGENRLEGALGYISKADLLSGEQDQFSLLWLFFPPLKSGLLSFLLHCKTGDYKRLTGQQTKLSIA